jgi:membrane protease YdiL (CAAX protease family)
MWTRPDDRFAPLQVPVFLLLTLFAWIIWIPQAAYRLGYIEGAASLRSPINALTVWAPGFAAIILSALFSGWSGVGRLLRPLGRWRVNPLWYIMALCFEPARWLISFGIDRLLGRSYELGSMPLQVILGAAPGYMMVVAVVFTLPNAIGEEIGWRGFALPRLQARYGALWASLILGIFWGIWHIPSWIGQGLDTSFSAMAVRVAGLVATAFVFTWIYNKTGGSLLLAVLFHVSIASKNYLFPSLRTQTDEVVLWVFVAVVVAASWRQWIRSKQSA